MQLANITIEDISETLKRGVGERESRIPVLLQEERSGVGNDVSESEIHRILDQVHKINIGFD